MTKYSSSIYVRRIFFIFFALLPLVAAPADRPHAAGIATAHPLATEAGHEILRRGGNAFDAAVAISATLGVVEPAGSGLGGGGFWLLHRAADSFDVMVDGRERAPLAATAGMYLDADGKPVPRLSLDGPLAAAIPGMPAAIAHLARKYGRLPLRLSLAPAIRVAEEGFPVSSRHRRMVEYRLEALSAHPAAAKTYLNEGRPPETGYRLRQPELARTLKRLATHGHDGFYAGKTARLLVSGGRAAGGIWSVQDLAGYRVIEREPVRGVYGNVRVTSAALPSSGGIVLVEMLNILQGYPLEKLGRVQRDHYIIEAMRRAYRDRAQYLGDSDYVAVDTQRLLDPAYAAGLRKEIAPRRATRSADLPGIAVRRSGVNTTHFSVIDRKGNRVAATLSINSPFGSGFMPPGTGVVLNNEMDDFVIKPSVPNVYGLVGTDANAIAAGKRPLSSMSPTFLESPDAVVALGTPGGSRIITMVLLATLEFAHGRGGVADWVALPRFHHQYLPDIVMYETGAFDDAEISELQKFDHRLQAMENGYGNMQAVMWNKKTGRVEAASDPRGEGQGRVE